MKHPAWALPRLLAFLNRARSAADILQAPELRDDPDSGSSSEGYVIGETVAQRLIDHRQQLPRRRYCNQKDILGVAGLGEDKLNDLLHSFSVPADEYFQELLFNGILLNNWEVRPYVKSFASTKELKMVTEGLDRFRLTVGELLAEQRAAKAAERRELMAGLRQAYVASYPDGHLASFPFAFWWYQFDQDNWFGFETMRQACESYLNYHGTGPDGMQFRSLLRYNDTPVNTISRRETLPVVVNYAEAKITLWAVELMD